MTPDTVRPALLGGLFIGVLSALPVVSAGNVCCCLWVVAGGVLAAYLAQQSVPTALTIGDGALVGLLAGLVGGFVTIVLQIPLELLLAPLQQQILERLLEHAGGLPFETRSLLEEWGQPARPLVFVLRIVFSVTVGMVFGLVGGILGAAIFKTPTSRSHPSS
jgi:hypothetical protein